ncbi:MAG TPA: urease accessory protein UreF [Terriglobales bacterium]|nr:urease accessory protein UreF [Terriglobales bacterium]
MSIELLALLQLSDGLFPAGGFAHSLGLETYVQDGLVKDRAGLEAFVTAHLDGSAGPSDAVAVAEIVRRAAADDLEGCLAIDARLDAMRVVPEFRTSSRQMGRQALRAVTAWGPDPLLDALAARVDASATPGHYPVVFGAAAGRGGIEPGVAASAYLFATASMLVNAALRLFPIGQLDAQRTLAALRPRIAALAADAARASLDDMWSFTPGLELAGLRHAELDMRLFRS